MSPAPNGYRRGQIITRTVAFVLFASGAVQVWVTAQGATPSLRYLPGLLGVAVGAGLWLRTRWARWLALGACFIAIAGACVVPVLGFLFRSHYGMDSALASNLWSSAFALLVGAIGYFGLGYFRSDLGRREFLGNPDAEDLVPDEPSSAVILSSLVWVVAVGLAAFGGVEDSRGPATAPPAQIRASNTPELPDLVPLGLCFREAGTARHVDIGYANIGKGGSSSRFRLSTSDSWGRPGRWLERDLDVPAPGEILTVPYESEADETRKRVLVKLDEEHRVAEVETENNLALFAIRRDSEGKLVLLPCAAMRLMLTDHKKDPVRTWPPNLVPLGLCVRGDFQLNVHFTNLGGPKPGLFQISQGNTPKNLSIVDAVYNPVPNQGEVRSFSLGNLATLVPRTSKWTDIYAGIDAAHAIEETDETDNTVYGRVTRLPDGKTNLPACDALDDNFYDFGGVHYFVEPPPLPPPPPAGQLPDLVPLGLCRNDEFDGRGLVKVVIGNVGKAKGGAQVEVTAHLGRDLRPVYGVIPFTPWPNAVGKAGLSIGSATPRDWAAGRSQLSLDVDPRHLIAELDDTNNAATFEIVRGEDGNIDLPDCTLVDVRVEKWGKTAK